MVLSDSALRQCIERDQLVVSPYYEELITPCSLDLTLSEEFWKCPTDKRGTRVSLETDLATVSERFLTNKVIFAPHTFVLGRVEQYLGIPDFLVGHLNGRSRLARLGISVHGTAGTLFPGWKGHLILELANNGPYSVELNAGDRVCSVEFTMLDMAVTNQYQGHYQNQKGV